VRSLGDDQPSRASAAVTPEFEELVRDALHHLYDLSHLQTHPLSSLIGAGEHRASPSGRLVRQALLDAIEAINPGAGAGATSRAWRSYRILELRFIEELDIGDVIRQVALSKSQYHRAQSRAIQAVASYLWERWRVDRQSDALDRPPATVDSESGSIRAELQGFARTEAAPDLDFLNVLRQVTDLLAPLERQYGVGIRVRADEPVPPIRGSRVMLRQALLAILSHAVVASRSAWIDVAVRQRGLEVDMSVTGQSQGLATRGRLGLDDCAPFVEKLGGVVVFDPTEPASGLWTASLRFPALHGPLLLVVDNDQSFVDLIRRYLAEREWAIVGASTADEALEVARARTPAAVLLDVVLPDRDGWELLLDLRRSPATRDVPVVVCSALDEREMARSLDAAAYLRKPVTQADVVTALADLTPRRARTAS
jgi:CheY-like chemotaxis protein